MRKNFIVRYLLFCINVFISILCQSVQCLVPIFAFVQAKQKNIIILFLSNHILGYLKAKIHINVSANSVNNRGAVASPKGKHA